MRLDELILKKEDCCGCGACAAVCPRKAISLEKDSCGFVYPYIEETLCIDCRACVKECQYHERPKQNRPLIAYAARCRDEELVKNSASGGVFASMATSWIGDKGIAAGAVMEIEDDDIRVFHKLAEETEEIYPMQGSKYVQSDACACYGQVLSALKSGQKVLFSGTPCQVAAIKKISGDPEELLTLDHVCHGVPSQGMFEDFIAVLSKKFKCKVVDLVFRDKNSGKNFCAKIGTKYGDLFIKSRYLSYYELFLNAIIYRDSCYKCPYAGLERVSDITMGDYWGIEEIHGKALEELKMPANKHWSCLLVNTEKGRRAIEAYGADMYMIPSEAEWAAEHNEQLKRPVSKPADRERLMTLYAQNGYSAIESDHIAKCGGAFVFYRRMIKSILANHAASRRNR